MKIYGMIVHLTADEERATREKVISYLAEKPAADEKPLLLKACDICAASENWCRGTRMSETFDRKIITPAEREARKLFRAADAVTAMTEHERAQRAFHDNRQRLKALRLAREAGEPKAK
jgi:hypothetical protein